MSFIGEQFEEQLTHEGILDVFKSKNIETTARTLVLLSNLERDDIDSNKEYIHIVESVYDGDEKPSTGGIDKSISVLKSFLSGSKSTIVVSKKYNNDKLKITKDGVSRLFNLMGKKTEPIETFKKYFNNWIGKTNRIIAHSGEYKLNESTVNKLKEIVELMEKIIPEIAKDSKITDKKVTTESALTIEEVTTETAVNLSGVLELIKARDELETLSHSLTTESGFTFVTKVKDFFANTIREIKNKLSNIFSQQDITVKYQEDKIKELKLLTNMCSKLGSIKFSQIEYIELPIMMGMKPNYNQTVFELNNLLVSFKGAIEQIEDLNNLLSNLIVDKDDIRISNNPKLYKFAREILDTRNKTTRIVNEITETKQPVDVKKATNLFNNLGSIKDINVNYINLYQETIKFDITKYVIAINRLSSLLTTWIDSVNDRDSDVKYSSNVINIVQDNVSNIANITTNLGIYIAYLNQTSAFFITDIKMLNEKI